MSIEAINQFTNKLGSRTALGKYISYESRVAGEEVKSGLIQINEGDPCFIIHVKPRGLDEKVKPAEVFTELAADFGKLARYITDNSFSENGHVLGITTSMIGRIATRYGFEIVPTEIDPNYSDGTRWVYEQVKNGRPYDYNGMVACYLPAGSFVERFSE